MKLYIVVYVAVRSLRTEVVWAGRQTERANAESMAPHSRPVRMAQHPPVALL